MRLSALLVVFAFVVAGTTPRAQQPLTAHDVVERVKQNIGVPWTEPTVDTFKDGDSTTRVTGVAVTMMATFEVLERAAAGGANLVITHEPTFYDHLDKLDVLEAEHDSVTAVKRDFIRRHHMVVVRMHDHWHRRHPEPMATALSHKLGWDQYRSRIALASSASLLLRSASSGIRTSASRRSWWCPARPASRGIGRRCARMSTCW